ncbi:MAG: MFS transporter [Chloroflexota bacterium]|nr:MFS transporter [Chloroflexota bacterium]
MSAKMDDSYDLRRNFLGGWWHTVFLTLGVSLTNSTTVVAAFVVELTGSTVWVGGFSTLLIVASTLPQLFIARLIEPRPRKMPYLMLAIYLRVVSWGLLAFLILTIGAEQPEILAWVLIGLLAVFYVGGGLGGVPYTAIIGKVIPAQQRGKFFGGKGVLAGPLAIGAALLARYILAAVAYPQNYALLFGLAAVSLFIASIGFWIIREPPLAGGAVVLPWREYRGQLGLVAQRLRNLVGVQLLTGFSLMVLPFYVVYAREELGAPAGAVGWFTLAQVLGGMVSNLLWARLVDSYGSRRMLMVCAVLSSLTPLTAIWWSGWGWRGLLPVIFLAGATFNGRSVGFSSALLELAPAAERSTYAALNRVLLLPVAFLSLIAGILLQSYSYQLVFLVASFFTAGGAILTRRLPSSNLAT